MAETVTQMWLDKLQDEWTRPYRDVLKGLAVTTCREWVEEKANRCNAPAEFVLWGKLFEPSALGPRCYDHAAAHAGHKALGDPSWAILDLRPALRLLPKRPTSTNSASPKAGTGRTPTSPRSRGGRSHQMPSLVTSEPVKATAWSGGPSDDEVYSLEGDDVLAHAELSDVDEVALVIALPLSDDGSLEVLIVHLDRVHAIALAGQIAAAATADHTILPKGHVNG